jgi:hypothetical protein
MEETNAAPARRSAESSRWPLGAWAVLGALSLVAAAMVLVSTSRYGAGLSPDSVDYVAAARSIAEGKGLVMSDGSAFVVFAPLYPTLLGLVSIVTRLDPLSFVHIINAILLAGVIFLSGVLLSRCVISSRTLALLGVVAVLVGRPLATVSVMAWTEPVFVLCVLLFLLSAGAYVRSASTSSLAGMTLCAAVAPLVRYVGVVVILVGVFVILVRRGTPRRTRMVHLLGFMVVSAVPWSAWVMRNYRLTGTLMGPRYSSVTPLQENIRLAIVQVLFEFLGSRHGRLGPVRLFSGIALASAAIVASFCRVRQMRTRTLQPPGEGRFLASPMLFFTALYALFVIVSSTATAYDSIDQRLMAPVYVPLVLVLFTLLDRFLGRAHGRLRTVTLTFLVIWLIAPAAEVCAESHIRSRIGAGGYNTISWRESPTMDLVEHLPAKTGGTIYSNNPDAIYILARRAAVFSPARTYYRSTETASSLADMAGSWPSGGRGLLVWFSNKSRPYLFSPAELASVAELDTVAPFKDGVVYQVSVGNKDRHVDVAPHDPL